MNNDTVSPKIRRFLTGVPALIVILMALAAAPVAAHVELDSPNGGERLVPGSIHTIEWRETVNHGPVNFDLWYSTSGSDGPWIEIAMDLTPTAQPVFTHDWLVPNTPSTEVFVRVRQQNDDYQDFEDISDDRLAIGHVTEEMEVSLEPMQDATLYEEAGSIANGSGSYLFTGRTDTNRNGVERRSLLAFDIEGAIPIGATITGASLDLYVSKTNSGDQTVVLYRVTESWSEGQSNPSGQEGHGTAAQDGDATWLHRSYPSNMWGSVGGSIVSATSGSQTIGDTGPYTFESTPEMIADVQSWLDSPSGNYGWAVLMSEPPVASAKRFNSRDHGTADNRPMLRVTYEGGGSSPLEPRVFIPAAARAEGAGGSFFITTADIHNPGTSSAMVSLAWLPRNSDNSTPARSADFTLDPGETRRFEDLLTDAFGLSSGVGAAAVLSDSDAVVAMTRTFNAGADGTFGQSLPGVAENELIREGTRALVLFLTEDGELRSNLGLVNGIDSTITVRWELFASDGTSLGTGSTSLPPWGNKQFNRVLEDYAPIEAAYAHVWTTTSGGAFTCYGSVLDEVSSDPTTVLPR